MAGPNGDGRSRQRTVDGEYPTHACIGCGKSYPEVTFGLRKRSYTDKTFWLTRCVECKRTMKRRQFSQASPQIRNSYLKRTYGITLEDWESIFESQGRRCAACYTDTPGEGARAWHVDHDHRTRKVRGILCHGCNTGIGNLGDDPLRLRMAANYLEACHG